MKNISLSPGISASVNLRWSSSSASAWAGIRFTNRSPRTPTWAIFTRTWRPGAFTPRVFFLAHRLQIQHAVMKHPGPVVQDRSIYEDAEIFALNLYLQGYLAQRDYETYRALYQSMNDFPPCPTW